MARLSSSHVAQQHFAPQSLLCKLQGAPLRPEAAKIMCVTSNNNLVDEQCSMQALVAGDNVWSAWPVMDLATLGKCSTWKYNTPRRFYQCRLFALQYDPVSQAMRYTLLDV